MTQTQEQLAEYYVPEEPDIHGRSPLEGYSPLGAAAVLSAEDSLRIVFEKERLKEIQEAADYFTSMAAVDEYWRRAKQAAEAEKESGKSLRTALMEVRDMLLGLDEDQHDILDGYLQKHLPEAFLSMQEAAEAKEAEDAEDGEEEAGHEPDYARWLATAPNSQLLNFLQWHNNRIEQINSDPAVRDRIAVEKQQYVELVLQAVSRKDLPESAGNNLSTVAALSTFVGDVFDTDMEGHDGYYSPEYEHNVLTEGYRRGIHFHELVHATLGEMASSIFDEAMAAHIRLCLEHGDFLVMDPDQRDDEGEYRYRRKLMSDVLTLGLLGSLVPDAIRAFCAYDTDGPEYDAYLDKLSLSYDGVSIAGFIDAQMSEAYELIESGAATGGRNAEEYALAYADVGVRYLADILRGKTNEEIVAPSVKRIRTLKVSSVMIEKLLEKRIVPAVARLEKIRHYIANARSEMVA